MDDPVDIYIIHIIQYDWYTLIAVPEGFTG